MAAKEEVEALVNNVVNEIETVPFTELAWVRNKLEQFRQLGLQVADQVAADLPDGFDPLTAINAVLDAVEKTFPAETSLVEHIRLFVSLWLTPPPSPTALRK